MKVNVNCKRELNYIYDQKLEGVKIRSKCNWNEDGEKYSNFFLNLKKIEPFKAKFVQ